MRKQSRVLPVSMVIVIAGILALQSCGSGSLFGSSGVTRSAGGFQLTTIPDPAIAGQSARALRLEAVESVDAGAGDDVILRVSIDNSSACKAAYFKLSYDSARYTPVAVEAGPALRELAAPGRLLELSVLDRPGTIFHGQCLAGWDKLAGFSGDGLLATVRFARRPFAAQAKSVSTPPDSALSQTTLTWDEPSATLSWRFYSQGDYNQDGEVGINDLTPLGKYFVQTCTYPADENTAKACADGDHNGELNIADITPIGSNFGNKALGGWNVWACGDIGQYPADPADDNGSATNTGHIGLDEFDSSTTRANDRVLYTYTIATPVAGVSYWVRALDGDQQEGIASNCVTSGDGANHAPEIHRAIFSAGPIASGGWLTVVTDATDEDDDTLNYTCSSNSDVIISAGDDRPESFLLHMPVVSIDVPLLVHLEVDDGRGGMDSADFDDTIAAPVAGNSAPVIEDVQVTPNPVPSSGTAVLSCSHSDPDGDIRSITWVLDATPTGYIGLPGTSVTYHAPTVSSDLEIPVTVYVDDGHGHCVADNSLTIHVTVGGANVPPTAVLSADPLSGDAPLTVNFDASGSSDTDGSIATYDWDWDGDGTYDLLDGGVSPVHLYDTAGTYPTTVRVTDDDSATDTDTETITVNAVANHPPVPVIIIGGVTGSPTLDIVPLDVVFDGTSSHDEDGDPLTYAWDYESDTVVDSTEAQCELVYTAAGSCTTTLTVSDGIASDDAEVEITVSDSGTWHWQTVDSWENSGMLCSLANVNGVPGIAYYCSSNDNTQHYVMYAEGADSVGSTFTPGVVQSTSVSDVSLFQNFGEPAIAYAQTLDCNLYYTTYDQVGMNWWPPLAIDTSGQVSNWCTLFVFNGSPRVTYSVLTSSSPLVTNLSIVNSYDEGYTWGTPVVIDAPPAGQTGTPCSFADINGRIGLSYQDTSEACLKFAIATDIAATSWNIYIVEDDPFQDIGRYNSLALIANHPAVSYVNMTTGACMFKRAQDDFGSDWSGTAQWLVNGATCNSLAEVAGHPAVAVQVDDTYVAYLRASKSDSFAGFWSWDIDTGGGDHVGQDINLMWLNGIPMVACYNQSSGDLRFAAMYP